MLLVGALLAALGALNQTLYGAASFVERYFEAIANDDLITASNTPGVRLDAAELEAAGLPADISTAMLRSNVIETAPDEVRVLSDVANDDGSHTVTVSYRLDTAIIQSEFVVRPIEPLYGVLNRWEFATSPLAVIDVTAAHDPVFTVGTLTLDTRATKTGEELSAFTQTAPYLAIAPAVYEFTHDEPLLEAVPVTLPAEPGVRAAVTVDALPTAAFIERVQAKVDEFLVEDCASQPVLQPAGCPFGVVLDDRVVSEPAWRIDASPQVTLVPGETTFEMPPTDGIAHITVEMQSLFDGEFYTLEQDEIFTLALDASIRPDGSISIQLK